MSERQNLELIIQSIYVYIIIRGRTFCEGIIQYNVYIIFNMYAFSYIYV